MVRRHEAVGGAGLRPILVDRIEIATDMVVVLKTGRSLRAPTLGRTDTLDFARRERGRDGRFWTPFEAEPDPSEPL